MSDTQFITDREIYERVILGAVPDAGEFVWIGTASTSAVSCGAGGRKSGTVSADDI